MDNQLKQKCQTRIQNFVTQIKKDKSRPVNIQEYYVLPYLYANIGQREDALNSLNFILDKFSTHDGGIKSQIAGNRNKPMTEQLTEVMSWLAIAAHQVGRFEISYTFSKYLRSYYDPEQGAFTAIAPYGRVEAVLDLFSTTMLGWLALTMGDLKKAQRAGNFLQRVISLQTTKDQVFYLRLEDDGKLVTNCAKKDEHYYWVTSQKAEHNLHYLSMAVIFLAKLFHATKEESYLRSAQAYLETVNGYSDVPHSISAWATATLANITREQRYIDGAQGVLSQILGQPEASDSRAILAIILSESLMELSVV